MSTESKVRLEQDGAPEDADARQPAAEPHRRRTDRRPARRAGCGRASRRAARPPPARRGERVQCRRRRHPVRRDGRRRDAPADRVVPRSRPSHRAARGPTLAAVHGTCMAGGFELALFCDLIWAAEGTMMGLPETRFGIVPLAGGVERVVARAGLTRARTIAIGGELHAAEVLATWGVIDRVL